MRLEGHLWMSSEEADRTERELCAIGELGNRGPAAWVEQAFFPSRLCRLLIVKSKTMVRNQDTPLNVSSSTPSYGLHSQGAPIYATDVFPEMGL